MDGSKYGQGDTWIVVSDYDPEIIPAKDIQELKERLHGKADEKREERRLKRLKSVEYLGVPITSAVAHCVNETNEAGNQGLAGN